GLSRMLAYIAAFMASMVPLSFAAQIGSAPITAQYFNQVSLVGISANAMIVPLLWPLMGFGFLAWGVSLVSVNAASSIAFAVLPGEKQLEVTFLDVGQGDSIVVSTPGNHTLVVDTGRSSGDDDAGRSIVLPFLRSKGLNSIDAMLLTHPDDDHIGGAISILER